uniref:Ribosomal protein S12 n=1 Tax=Hydatigena taeniaeformis TaxID=6205 RepID=A0A0R3WX54_HYDTA
LGRTSGSTKSRRPALSALRSNFAPLPPWRSAKLPLRDFSRLSSQTLAFGERLDSSLKSCSNKRMLRSSKRFSKVRNLV